MASYFNFYDVIDREEDDMRIGDFGEVLDGELWQHNRRTSDRMPTSRTEAYRLQRHRLAMRLINRQTAELRAGRRDNSDTIYGTFNMEDYYMHPAHNQISRIEAQIQENRVQSRLARGSIMSLDWLRRRQYDAVARYPVEPQLRRQTLRRRRRHEGSGDAKRHHFWRMTTPLEVQAPSLAHQSGPQATPRPAPTPLRILTIPPAIEVPGLARVLPSTRRFDESGRMVHDPTPMMVTSGRLQTIQNYLTMRHNSQRSNDDIINWRRQTPCAAGPDTRPEPTRRPQTMAAHTQTDQERQELFEENAWRGMFRANLIDVFRQLRESNPESTEKRVSPADGCTASCSSVKSSAVETPDEVQNSDIAEKCENETGEASSRPEEGPSTEDGRERTETVCNAGEKMGDCCKKLMKEGQSFCCNQCGKHWHSCLQSTGYHRCRRDGGEPEKENRPGVIQTPHVESDKPNDRLPESDHATENRSGINKSSISLDTESVSKQFSSMEGLTSSTATSSEVETTCTQLSYFSGTGYDSAISKEELKPGGLRGDVRCNPPRTLPRGSKSLCATRAKSMTICESGVEENYCSMENRNVITVSTISLPPSVRGHPATTKVVIAGRHWRSVYKAYFNYFVREIERQHEDGNRPSGQLLNTLHLQKKVSLAIIDSIVDQTLGCLTFSNKFPNI